MSADSKRALLKFSGGAGLFPAFAAALEHFAGEAKLSDSDRNSLVAACEQVYGDALGRAGASDSPLELTIEQFADRLEVSISHPGITGPAVGLDTFLGAAGPPEASGANLLTRVDRVKYDTSGQASRMILVKYLPGAKTRAN
ncbi:MAG TPA: hypothetical protein VMV61_07660 [Patescibacteria group bacterium]|nr:hypothetical protein [Patescibacteria group bacterium]